MSFWTWALEAYARPGAADACLQLQDRSGQCVPYLLWAAWAASEDRRLDDKTLEAGAELCQSWEAAAVGPLRQARRAMKGSVAGIREEALEALRAEVKALELKAERLLIETLEALSPEAGCDPLPLSAALSSAVGLWPSSAPPEALERLAQTLS